MNEFAPGAVPAILPAPMSFGQILEHIWRILRKHAGLFLKLGAVIVLPFLLVLALFLGALFAGGALPPHPGIQPDVKMVEEWMLPALFIGMIPNFIAFAVYQAAASIAAVKAISGDPPSACEAFREAWKKTGRYCLLIFLQYLCIAWPMLAAMTLIGVCALLIQISGGGDTTVSFLLMPLIFLLYLVSFVASIWLGLRFGLAFPAAVSEDLPASMALKRSSALTRNAKGRMFLVLLVVYAISYAAIMVLEFGGMAIGMMVALPLSALHVGLAWEIAAAAVGGILLFAALYFVMGATWAAYVVSFSVMYCDQRRRIDPLPAGQPEISQA